MLSVVPKDRDISTPLSLLSRPVGGTASGRRSSRLLGVRRGGLWSARMRMPHPIPDITCQCGFCGRILIRAVVSPDFGSLLPVRVEQDYPEGDSALGSSELGVYGLLCRFSRVFSEEWVQIFFEKSSHFLAPRMGVFSTRYRVFWTSGAIVLFPDCLRPVFYR